MCGEITLFLNCVVPENIHTLLCWTSFQIFYCYRSSKWLLLFAVIIFDLRSGKCSFFSRLMRQFSFYLPPKNIVPQLFFFTEIFLPEGTPNKFKNKGNSKGLCVWRGGEMISTPLNGKSKSKSSLRGWIFFGSTNCFLNQVLNKLYLII